MIARVEKLVSGHRERFLSEGRGREKTLYYEHKQNGSWFWLVFGIIVFEIIIVTGALADIIYRQQKNVLFMDVLSMAVLPMLVGLPVLFWAGLLMSSMTVRIYGEKMTVRSGGGLFHKTFLLRNIADCRTVKHSWLRQKGVRWAFNGWRYNVSGMDAVELTFKNGKKARIGSDQPEILCHVVKEALHRTNNSSRNLS